MKAELKLLGPYPEDPKGKTPVLQYFQSKNQDFRGEKYKTALIDLILAHCLGMLKLFVIFFI